MASYSPSYVDSSKFITPPSDQLAIAQLSQQGGLGSQVLANQNQLLKYGAAMPIETWTPDIWGANGANTQAAQAAALNAFNSKKMEAMSNPAAAAMREQLPQMLKEDASQGYWEKQMNQFNKTHGISQYLGSGMQDSTIGKSAMFDRSTAEGMALRARQEQALQGYLNATPAPIGGIDPSAGIAAQQAAEAQGVQARQNRENSVYQGAQASNQSTLGWLNQMMGSQSNAINAHNQNWQNYQNAMLNSATQNANMANQANAANAAGTNALIGAGISAIGGMAGSYMGA